MDYQNKTGSVTVEAEVVTESGTEEIQKHRENMGPETNHR